MNPRICICCGEPMPEKDHGLSRNPNVCASCSSMADGMEDVVLETLKHMTDSPPVSPSASESGSEPRPKVGTNWTAVRFLKHE